MLYKKYSKTSNRILNVPASPIRKLVPYAEEAKRQGVKIYHLNIGDPDIKTPSVMIDVLKNWSDNPIPYSQSQGDINLIKSVLFYYRKIGFNFLEKNNIQITNGGSEGISMVFFAVCEAGDEIIVFEPLYTNYNSYAAVNQIKLIPIRTYAESGFHLPKIEEIEKRITKKTKAILICNPSNPTGTVYSKEEIEMLVNLVKKYNLFLIVDEVYREFVYDGKKQTSILEYMREIPLQVILIDSLSKRYSICGARLGMIVSLNKDLMNGILRMAQGRLSCGYIDQKMAEKLTEVPEEYFNSVREEYEKRRNVLYDELTKIQGVFLKKPEGAFYAVVKLPVDDTEKFCLWLLTDFRYMNSTVMLAPAAGFYVSPGLGKDEVRIAYVINVNNLKKAIEILKKGLISYQSKNY